MAGYPVPAARAETELRFKNSRFIGTAGLAESSEEAKAFVARVRARFPDASHHCFAYAVGHGASVVCGLSDDGEPSGTAGRPILAVVQGSGLGDVVVVVSRYFGGTKLGTGGLVRAYTETAQAVLARLPHGERIDAVELRIGLGYEHHAQCRRLIEEVGGTVEEEVFGQRVDLRARIERTRVEALRQALLGATSGRASLEEFS